MKTALTQLEKVFVKWETENKPGAFTRYCALSFMKHGHLKNMATLNMKELKTFSKAYCVMGGISFKRLQQEKSK